MHNDIQASCTGAEIAVGEIFGLRGFLLDGVGRLLPVTYRGRDDTQPWRPGENVARCATYSGMSCAKSVTLPVPVRDCTCGFYGYFDHGGFRGSNLCFQSEGTELRARAVIAVYGRCLVGNKGFRAQKARIVAIAGNNAGLLKWSLRRDRFYQAAEAYGVPVYRNTRQMLKAHPLSEAPRTVATDPRFWDEI